MAAISYYPLFLTLTAILITLHFFSLYASHNTLDFVVEDKARMGSTPPSCHSKCNQCHPCMAKQVPTLPGRVATQPGRVATRPVQTKFKHDRLTDNKYSNYKPLGWKCTCKNHFYNP